MTHRGSRVLHVGSLARVEGETALHLRTDGDRVVEARLAIYEPPRFFEAFLRGRSHTEPPDITSRVCGICPVAYQLSACRAVEDTCGVVVDGQLAALRRLLYCGEWIESQTLHIHLLHAPDFLGCDSAIDLARTRRADVERGLRLKQAGNAIMELLGGRAIHPVNVRLGGFHRVPTTTELRPLAEQLRRARDDAQETVRWVAASSSPTPGATTTCSPWPNPAPTPSSPAPRPSCRRRTPPAFPPDPTVPCPPALSGCATSAATSSRGRCPTPPPCSPSWTGAAT